MEQSTESSENRKKPQFGNRYLTDPGQIFQHNAWDDVEWNEEIQQTAEEKLKSNSKNLVPASEQIKYEAEASAFWDQFYNIHKNRFFKDRHWLFTEFPELCQNSKYHEMNKMHNDVNSIKNELSNTCLNIWEVGCGVGNTVFPLLEANRNTDVFVYCSDFSEVAISLIKNNPSFDIKHCSPFVCDISANEWEVPFKEESLDFILLIFTLSAIHPLKMPQIINKMSKYLKPGGQIIFRDYGKYDMVELRFKSGQCLSEHFYVRGDGTRVYFFSEDEVHKLFSQSGLIKIQNFTSRRLQVNRGKLLKMYRIWIQAKYMKPK